MRVVWSSFGGRYSDNPRALYEQLGDADVQSVWLCDPAHAAGFPAGVPRVDVASPAARLALETADLVVSNTHLELAWDKAPHTRYLQTWHGTPLKHIHWDVRWAPAGRLEELDPDVRRWDALVSPSPAATGPLRGAFRFDGELAETGYPRNDVLSSPGRGAVRDRVRRDLGIADDVPVVLYAPTWRDDLLDRDGALDFRLHLDVAELTARLPDHVLLLRLHYMLSGRLAEVAHPRVHDVSFHPDISELYLAADVMVTDYSSTMFDFAVTGKPIVFFTYDLDHYRDGLRGFYFDFAEIAPGPLLATGGEVVDALADLDAVTRASREAYDRFTARFCPLEDGRAGERVLARFVTGADASPTALEAS